MTEKELIDAGFEKQEARHSETGNGYDYYYYINELCDGVCLISSDSIDSDNDHWIVKSFDIPALRIETVEHLRQFLEIVRNLTGCEDV